MDMARQSTGAGVPVLLTRPEAASRAFAAALEARFGARVRVVVAPLMAPVLLSPPLPEGEFSAVIFTSATGVAAARGRALPKRAYCVGRETARQALAVGFEAVSADGDAAALVAAVLADPPGGRMLHLRGEETRGDVAERLMAAGVNVCSVVVYRQEAVALTAEAVALLAGTDPVVVPLFSPRSAVLFREAVAGGGRGLWLAAMSEPVAEVVRDLAPAALEVARRPDAEAMLEAVGRLIESASPP